jgi:hypothetical protein
LWLTTSTLLPSGVEHERAVVAGVVLRALSRRAVVAVAGVDACAPERVRDRGAGRGEADVEPARYGVLGAGRREREVVPLDQLVAGVRRLDP